MIQTIVTVRVTRIEDGQLLRSFQMTASEATKYVLSHSLENTLVSIIVIHPGD